MPSILGSASTFDLSRKTAYALVIIILFGYMMGAGYELLWNVDYLDYNRQKLAVEAWSPEKILQSNSLHVRYALDKLSIEVFDSPKVVPFAASVALLITVFFFAKDISGRYIGGVLALAVLSSNNLFKFFDTSGVYENYWVLFYVLSLYVLGNRWQLSPVFFILSVFSKPLTLAFLPTTFLWIYYSSLSSAKKVILAVTYVVPILAFYLSSVYLDYITTKAQFVLPLFIDGLTSWWYYIVADWWMPAAVPAMMMLMLALAAKRTPWALLCGVGLVNMALSGIVQGFAYDVENEPYRYIPLVTFFALSIGVFFRIKRKERKHEDIL